ncbi:RNA-binding protein 42-like [Planoprotostelium fungivorum]|uniref:RNA-binding protein 42-like n=1 Tax=Planoprotostelium fungivorum TaxID=1890364 RepID=A0A2P6NUQ5_9EUKA|nr:RNA-binding protein 42-like [Planoprotostelium fungivorum]
MDPSLLEKYAQEFIQEQQAKNAAGEGSQSAPSNGSVIGPVAPPNKGMMIPARVLKSQLVAKKAKGSAAPIVVQEVVASATSSRPRTYDEFTSLLPSDFSFAPQGTGKSYQEILKSQDKNSAPKYVFPQHAPAKPAAPAIKASGSTPIGNQLQVQPVPDFPGASVTLGPHGQTGALRITRQAAGTTWEDSSLGDWDPNDFRIFVGDLGNEVNDELLARAFNKYPSFQRAKVLKDKKSGKSRGYAFVSFRDSADYARAMKEMNGKYIGNRPCKLTKSKWKERAGDAPTGKR